MIFDTIIMALFATLAWILFGSFIADTETPLKEKVICIIYGILFSALSLIMLFFTAQNLELTIFVEIIIILIMTATWIVGALVSYYYVKGRWE